jgi:glucose/arabinose dehydrogenase
MRAVSVLKNTWLGQPKIKSICNFSKGTMAKQLFCILVLLLIVSFSLKAELLLPKESLPKETLSKEALPKESLPKETYSIEKLATGLNSPWSMVALPNDTWLITERDGHVVIKKGEQQQRVKLALEGLYVAGQGGLLDIVLSPDFNTTNEVILTYAQGELKANRLVVAKARFNGQQFSKPTIIYQIKTDKGTPQHYAGRILVLPDNTLLISSGDGFDYREQAQVIDSQLGKIIRINLDGSIPTDNPFIASDNSATTQAVFSLGHRNPQGLVYNDDAQQIISHEHGPAGGDELNYLTAGNNYGWPVITYGKDYSQARISPFTEYQGMQQPSVNWTPSIAPSGMAYYSSKFQQFPSLQQSVLITTLVDRKLYAVNMKSGQFEQRHIFTEISGRLRDVFITSSGEIAVLTDGKDADLLLIKAH